MKKICVLLTITFGLLLFSSCGDWLDVLSLIMIRGGLMGWQLIIMNGQLVIIKWKMR